MIGFMLITYMACLGGKGECAVQPFDIFYTRAECESAIKGHGECVEIKDHPELFLVRTGSGTVEMMTITQACEKLKKAGNIVCVEGLK